MSKGVSAADPGQAAATARLVPPCHQRCMPRHRPAAIALGALALLSLPSGPALAQASARTSAKTSVETRQLGRLELENGYPTATTARKLYNELDLQRATQAYLHAPGQGGDAHPQNHRPLRLQLLGSGLPRRPKNATSQGVVPRFWTPGG